MCSAVRGCAVQGEHVCESTSGSLPWGHPKERERVTHGETRKKTVRDQMGLGTRASVRGPTQTPLPIPIPCLSSLPLADPSALQRSSPLPERPLLTSPTHIPLSTPHSSHTRRTQTAQLSSEESHPRVSLVSLISCGPTLSNTRCLCERHGETYECFKCLHVNICMHRTYHEAFHQNH